MSSNREMLTFLSADNINNLAIKAEIKYLPNDQIIDALLIILSNDKLNTFNSVYEIQKMYDFISEKIEKINYEVNRLRMMDTRDRMMYLDMMSIMRHY